jgi:hypothetical protein
VYLKGRFNSKGPSTTIDDNAWLVLVVIFGGVLLLLVVAAAATIVFAQKLAPRRSRPRRVAKRPRPRPDDFEQI